MYCQITMARIKQICILQILRFDFWHNIQSHYEKIFADMAKKHSFELVII